ncbi:hypothetical protein GF325_04095 [Candidatus Bathyarchaeota archaeon]|nr:hypothetical protein [Candidatus Bathyarchaeota archaeon]
MMETFFPLVIQAMRWPHTCTGRGTTGKDKTRIIHYHTSTDMARNRQLYLFLDLSLSLYKPCRKRALIIFILEMFILGFGIGCGGYLAFDLDLPEFTFGVGLISCISVFVFACMLLRFPYLPRTCMNIR